MTTQRHRSWTGDQVGGTFALVAVFMVVLIAGAALAVDMAMAFASRAEAQRIADSSSLAGASAFMDADKDLQYAVAESRAYEYALKHTIRGEGVDSSEVTIQVLTDSMKVRVWVNRQGLDTWFARIFGVDEMDVGAMAAAEAVAAGATRCLKPFAVPDAWGEPQVGGDDNSPYNRVWDSNETWDYGDDAGETYERFELDDPNSLTATGYGSRWRSDYNRDQGRQLALKLGNPQSNFSLAPGLFFPFRIEPSEGQASCDQGGGGGGQAAGGAIYRRNICECNTNEIQIGDSLQVEPGNMVGPTRQGIEELLAEDPSATWVPTADGGYVEDSLWEDNWMASPRVIKIALMDPTTINKGGMQHIHVNNFALFFLEDMPKGGKNKDDVTGRFIKFADGSGEGETSGSLVLYLRLVE